jgi:hypothetical protein
MENWNEWSWLAIPATAWAFAWMLRGASQSAHGPTVRRESPTSTWTLRHEETRPATEAEQAKMPCACDGTCRGTGSLAPGWVCRLAAAPQGPKGNDNG